MIKDAEALEIGRKVNAIVFDKTGTLTEGRPTVSDIYVPSESVNILPMLLSMEAKSEHPLASAIVDYLTNSEIKSADLNSFVNVPGRGVKAEDSNRNLYFAGNKRFILESGSSISDSVNMKATEWQNEAKTVVYFADSNMVLSIIAISDKIKTNSSAAIEGLKKAGIEVYMLTGDNIQTAKEVASRTGIDNFRAELLPADKAAFIAELQAQSKIVAMVGDGINDSEALATANLSIAMGQGSDIAMETAKITLMTSDLASVPKALKLSSKTVRFIRQNLFWAFIYNIVAIPIAAGALYSFGGFLLNPMIASAAMAFSSVSVVMNSLRLKISDL